MTTWYERKYEVLNAEDLMGKIRTFLAATGWVESEYTQSSPTQILVRTAEQHKGAYGILHLIWDDSNSQLEFHAYPPGHSAFAGPHSFNNPDITYLPGGENYNEGSDYFYSDYPMVIPFSSWPGSLWLFTDGNFLYVIKYPECIIMCGLVMERQKDFGWVHCKDFHGRYASIKVSDIIKKGYAYNKFVALSFDQILGSSGGKFYLQEQQYISRVVTKAWYLVYPNDVEYKEIFEIPHLRVGIKGHYGAGDIVRIGDTIFEYVKDNYDTAILIEQGVEP